MTTGLTAAFWIYLLTIVFAMGISVLIFGLGRMVKKLNLDKEDQVDMTIPSADSMKEEQMIAVAIAVAHAQKNKRT